MPSLECPAEVLIIWIFYFRLNSNTMSGSGKPPSKLGGLKSPAQNYRQSSGKQEVIQCRVCEKEMKFQNYMAHLKFQHPREDSGQKETSPFLTWLRVTTNRPLKGLEQINQIVEAAVPRKEELMMITTRVETITARVETITTKVVSVDFCSCEWSSAAACWLCAHHGSQGHVQGCQGLAEQGHWKVC